MYVCMYPTHLKSGWLILSIHISCNGCSEDGERRFHFELLNGEDGLNTGWR